MGCFSCFSSSTRQDNPSEKREKDEQIEIERAKEISLKQFEQDEEKRRLEKSKEESKRKQMDEDQEDEQLALTIQESSRQQEEQDKRRRTRGLEEDAQIANAFVNEKREKQNYDNSALEDKEDEQLGKPSEESLKERDKRKQLEEQVEKDEQLAVILQESLNMVKSPPRLEGNNNIASRAAPLDEDEQRTVLESLKGKGPITQSKDVEDDGKLFEENPPRSMCGGCNCEIEDGRSVDVLGVLWHPECFSCGVCHKPIAIHEVKNHVSNSRGKFHKSCYRRHCYVCKESVKMKICHRHPFWEEGYCLAHESDGTHKCCCCERLEPRGTNFVMLDDGRWLCLECMESAIMDTDEAQLLHFEIREFFEGLNMKIQKEFSLLLVERQALNKAEEEEKIDNQHGLVTRGICLSEAQTITSVSKGPKMGPNKQLIGMATESQRVVSGCEVTAILILYGLPRLQTGYILAHEMMHAYLRLNGHGKLNEVLEEGLCQVLGHMWLESQTYAPIDAAAASSAASSYSRTPEANASKKGDCSEFEKMLVEFCKYEIETNDSPVYGEGFRQVNQMVTSSSLQETLKEILRRR